VALVSIRKRSLLILVALSLTCSTFFVCKGWIFHKRSVLVIEPEAGQRKLRYTEQKAPAADSQGQILYNSLRGKADCEAKVLSRTKLLSKPETPMVGIRVGNKSAKSKATKVRSDLEVKFEEKESKYRSVPSQLYRVKVAPVRDLEEALKVWSVLKSKNPLFFSKFGFLLDKVFLPDGKVVHYLSMGDYKDFKVANLVSKKLESAGYRALIYEVVN
jgi:hypothetical protein